MSWLLTAASAIVTPAIIASLVTLFFNLKAEKKRAERDFVTKTFDAARDDVRRATEYAVDYFPKNVGDRTPALEAKLWMGERDVRHSVTALIEFTPEGSVGRLALQKALDDFIDALTGGSFQSAKAEADMEQVRRVSTLGGVLRASIWTARQAELRDAINSDILTRSGLVASAYLNQNMGPDRSVESEAPTSRPPSADK